MPRMFSTHQMMPAPPQRHHTRLRASRPNGIASSDAITSTALKPVKDGVENKAANKRQSSASISKQACYKAGDQLVIFKEETGKAGLRRHGIAHHRDRTGQVFEQAPPQRGACANRW